jgi:pyridoxine 5-phosphate synthase
VPERRQEVTTEGGLDVVAGEKALTETRKKMTDAGIEVSLFIAPDEKQIEAAARIGAEFIELHTGAFAESFFERFDEIPSVCDLKGTSQEKSTSPECLPGDLPELDRLITGAKHAYTLGLKVNAGHGLNYENLPLLYQVPHLVELNIGHSIVSRAVSVGLSQAVKEMLRLMESYRG